MRFGFNDTTMDMDKGKQCEVAEGLSESQQTLGIRLFDLS